MAQYLGWNQDNPQIFAAILRLVKDKDARVRAEVAEEYL